MPSLYRQLMVRFAPGGREILRLHRDIEGMLALSEVQWLYNAARGCKRIVEIGSYRGKSCVILALGCADSAGHVTAIDPHIVGHDDPRFRFNQGDHDKFMQTIRAHGVADRVTKHVLTSRDALPLWDASPIDLLWVDGDHSEQACRFDLEAWGALVRAGGTIAAHDYTRDNGVKVAWDSTITAEKGWGPTSAVRSLVWSTRS